ncbi:hypothetical protein HDV05_001715, partial [Chytridiales sp. JEL 0842]
MTRKEPISEALVADSPESADDEEQEQWSPEEEIVLLQALCKYRPVGVHHHFRMIQVLKHFNRHSKEPKTLKQIRDYMDTLYDLNTLNKLADAE